MEKKYINRFNSFCKSLDALEKVKDRDLSDDFVISGAIQKFSLTFDISWKVMKDILVNYHKLTSFATGSPRETLRTAASVKMITDDDWMDMLDDRNSLTHDYDGSFAAEVLQKIIDTYIPEFEKFKSVANEYMALMNEDA